MLLSGRPAAYDGGVLEIRAPTVCPVRDNGECKGDTRLSRIPRRLVQQTKVRSSIKPRIGPSHRYTAHLPLPVLLLSSYRRCLCDIDILNTSLLRVMTTMIQQYRLTCTTMAVEQRGSDGRMQFSVIPLGALLQIAGEAQQSGLVDVLYEGRVVAMFLRDIQDKGERILAKAVIT